ncbi:NADPH-dependent FMN reductase [Paenibacillus alkalitolerans]|uniref:NADPH-dependent FMN reductase n=1 Tax=Paenibacillus alkalitolerans TaxID=2799335 RepID=UPI0018F58866|nr:NADPH-dependent FMN reductase [Paenibacillus alkalitolerans]
MNIVLIAGSYRQDSTSTKLLRYMAKVLQKKGVEASIVDLREMPVPLYMPYSEQTDANTAHMIRSVANADGIVLGTPEYHGSVSGVLKNALDYMGSDEFSGKPVLCVSSSGGAVGVSSLTHMQAMVRNMHGINCSEWVSIGGEHRRFTEEGEPEAEAVRTRVDRALDHLIYLTRTLRMKQL